MPELTDQLQAHGFEKVDTDLPGAWATRSDVCINLQFRLRGHGFEHEVAVYGDPAHQLGVDSPELSRVRASSHARAVRAALAEANVGVAGADASTTEAGS